MAIISYRNLTVSFGGPLLLDDVGISIEKKERICLLGRNGEGKSTLLRILSGQVIPDKGESERLPNFRVAKLDQEIPVGVQGSIFDVVAEGLGEKADILRAYNQASLQLDEKPEDEKLADEVDRLQSELDRTDGWSLDHKVASIIDRVGLTQEQSFATLSGGNKSRALLARTLVGEPHVLILDEPTNHLDFEGIQWLEKFLQKAEFAVLFVSHDRSFIRFVATRILELDRGKLTSWTCGYDKFLERKADLLSAEEKQNAVFDKKLAEEEVWIRKGIQARRTRNEGRVRALFKLREERSDRREQQGKSTISSNKGQTSGRKVISIKDLEFGWDEQTLIKNFSTTIWRGDKIGVVGLNGSGKSTLLKLLLKKLEPKQGSIEHGTKLDVAYFDQHKEILNDSLSVAENVAPNGDTVTINGYSKHILSYLKDFLFLPETARGPVKMLSGGERARVLLAKFFLQPANLLVLDEPTNDLDIETIELLEERLLQFDGTLLLVSHDRDFLNNVVNATFAMDGKGGVMEYAGGCDRWLEEQEEAKNSSNRAKPRVIENNEKPRKLLNKEKEALIELPKKIEKMEAERDQITAIMQSPDYYRNPKSDPADDQASLEKLEKKIAISYSQWEELEAIAD
ncbi:ATP-binding cassette domain-containing protein [Candidatus Seribacter sulfatis]|uniref:ATP-binding cassette domain-containing protein n=1 Tax=Candidatus Seribacter sulfatis TaxID=3381756 RepID=UPI003899D947